MRWICVYKLLICRFMHCCALEPTTISYHPLHCNRINCFVECEWQDIIRKIISHLIWWRLWASYDVDDGDGWVATWLSQLAQHQQLPQWCAHDKFPVTHKETWHMQNKSAFHFRLPYLSCIKFDRGTERRRIWNRSADRQSECHRNVEFNLAFGRNRIAAKKNGIKYEGTHSAKRNKKKCIPPDFHNIIIINNNTIWHIVNTVIVYSFRIKCNHSAHSFSTTYRRT